MIVQVQVLLLHLHHVGNVLPIPGQKELLRLSIIIDEYGASLLLADEGHGGLHLVLLDVQVEVGPVRH